MTDFFYVYGAVYVVAALCFVAILMKGILSFTYGRLIRAAKDMGRSNHSLMKTLCKKFETCYELKIGVKNVDIFVEKYLRHYRVCGLHLKSYEAVCNLFMLLSMIVSLGSGILAMAMEMERSIVFSSLFVGVMGNGIILVFDCLYNVNAKKEMLRVDIIDFLENIYKPRLENETFHPEKLEEYRKEYFDVPMEDVDNVVNLRKKSPEKRNDIKIEFTQEEESVIREVLREYMG